jgi:hypothetical protein
MIFDTWWPYILVYHCILNLIFKGFNVYYGFASFLLLIWYLICPESELVIFINYYTLSLYRYHLNLKFVLLFSRWKFQQHIGNKWALLSTCVWLAFRCLILAHLAFIIVFSFGLGWTWYTWILFDNYNILIFNKVPATINTSISVLKLK